MEASKKPAVLFATALAVALLLPAPGRAAGKDKAKEKDAYKARLIGVPFIYYSPETKLASGGGGVFNFRAGRRKEESRTSSIWGYASYNLARQFSILVVGLSGLITPSLEEMVHVAREMQRQGFTVPLLIGGATTSRAHTAVKIAPAYGGPVVHVLDASRAVGVVSQLKSEGQRPAFEAENRREQERLRKEHEARRAERTLLSLEEARRRRTKIDWTAYGPPQPAFHGARELADVPLADLVTYVDWTPFFSAWELRGTYPRIFENPDWGGKARELFDDAQAMLKRLVGDGRLKARAVYGFFPANATGDDVEVYADEGARYSESLNIL